MDIVHTRVAAIVSGVAALVALAFFVGMFVGALEGQPYRPISFVNPALIRLPDGSIPQVEGIEGPAVYLGEPGEPVLPITWIERNDADRPIDVTYELSAQSYDLGKSVTLYGPGTARPPVQPGVSTQYGKRAVNAEVRQAVLAAAENGVCSSVWSSTSTVTPVVDDAEPVRFYTENYTIVVEGCGDES